MWRVQGQPEDGFSERMLIYNYRLRDGYHVPIVSLAVLSDENPSWRLDRYESEFWGCGLSFWFPVAKLLDYGSQWPVLEESRNPFATIVMTFEAEMSQYEQERSMPYMTSFERRGLQ